MSRAGWFWCYLTSPAGLLQKQDPINNPKGPSTVVQRQQERLSPATGQGCCGCCRRGNGLCPSSSSSFLRAPGSRQQPLLYQIKNPFGLPQLDGRTWCRANQMGLGISVLAFLQISGELGSGPVQEQKWSCMYKWGPIFALLSRDWDRNERNSPGGRGRGGYETPLPWQMWSFDTSTACTPMPIAGTHLCDKPLSCH